MPTNHQYFFVIFNIFTIFILCFCAICILFFIKFTLIFFLLPFSCSTCSAVPCFSCSICSTFPFFTIFSTIATVSAAISYPFAQSFCPFAVYKLVLFHFYFIHEKETPFLFRSSVSDICSSSVLSQSRKMMQNSVIPCFVIQVLSPFRKVTSTICSISSIFFPSIMRMIVSTLRFAISGTF